MCKGRGPPPSLHTVAPRPAAGMIDVERNRRSADDSEKAIHASTAAAERGPWGEGEREGEGDREGERANCFVL